MLCDLSGAGLLVVSGKDAKKLLQGQLTCDVEKITSTHSSLGAHCNSQGRVISLFYLFSLYNVYYLLMPRNMISIAITALKKYAIFYKVELSNATDSLSLIGCVNESLPKDLLDSAIIQVPDGTSRYIIATKKKESSFTTSEGNKWKQLDINAGIPSIYPETSEQFLPHELNLHQLNAISFEKGCYTGQEIIARMHYRSKLKNQMFISSIFSQSPLLPGTEIYSAQDRTNRVCGKIVDVYSEEQLHKEYNSYKTLIVTDEKNAKNQHLFLKSDNQTFFLIEDGMRR